LGVRLHVSRILLGQAVLVVFFGGLVNPLAIFYIVLRLLNRAPGTRKTVAIAILMCIPITWLFLSRMAFTIHVGHIAWIVGLLFMVWPISSAWPRSRDAKWIAVAPAILVVWWVLSVATLHPINPPTGEDHAYYYIAVTLRAPEVCERIAPYAQGARQSNLPGFEISYLQSDCYYDLARELRDVSLCGKVRPASKWPMDGSEISPAGCKKRLDGTITTASLLDDGSLTPIIRAAGSFDGEGLPDPGTGEQFVDRLRDDPSARAEFIRRIMVLR
jgi:hypothetical protein